jgi:hypothetical protein
MMKHFKLALFALLLIIGCVLAQAQFEEATEEHELAERGRGGNGGGNDDSSEEFVCVPVTQPTRRPSSSSGTPTSAPTSRPPTSKPTTTQAPSSPTTRPPTSKPTSKPTTPTQAPTAKPSSTTRQATTASATSTTSRTSTTGSGTGSSVGLCDVVSAAQQPLKLLVPLYVYPGSAWDTVVAGASKVGTIAIINPNSGPAASPDSTYNTYMTKLKNAGVEMVGYVYTSYGARSIADVKKDIDTYASKYPLVTGIFFDEVSDSSSQVAFYTQAYNYVMGKGYKHNILNPGVQPVEAYVDISTSIVVFEDASSKLSSKSFSSFVTCASSSSEKSSYKYKFAAIAHTTSSSSAASALATMQNKGLGLVYVTDGAAGCCTYNELVSYYSTMVSAVQSINGN